MAKEAISAVFPSRSLPRHRALCLATGFLRQPLSPGYTVYFRITTPITSVSNTSLPSTRPCTR